MEVVRLFFGLQAPPELRDALGRWQAAQGLPARWSRTEGLHLTLAFLGARPDTALPALEAIGATVAAGHRPFPLTTTRLGTFPEPRAPRVLWLGVSPAAALDALAADLRHHLTGAEEAYDARPFRAHLTLARLMPPRQPLNLLPPEPAAWEVDQLILFGSQPQGRYPVLRSWPLAGV